MEKPLKKECLLLNANESNQNPFNTQNFDLSDVALNRYPDSDQMRLKKAVSKELVAACSRYDAQCAYGAVSPENLIMGTGSDEILKLILETFLPFGGTVLAPSPSFSEYKKITAIVKGRFVEASFEDLNISILRLIQTAVKEDADVIFLANPNNPTGQLFSLEDINQLLDATNAHIVIDEAYAEFCNVTAIELALKNPRVIVTRTLSKAYGMAALRLGFAVATPFNISRMSALKLTYNISGISEWLALKALDNSDYVDRYTSQVIELREKALDLLRKLPNLKVYDSAANFILVEIESINHFRVLKQKLVEASIHIRTFAGESGRLDRCIRVTLTDTHEFIKVYEALGGSNDC